MAVEMAVTSYSFDTLCDGNPCCVCDAKCLLKVTRDFPSPQSVASSLYKKFNEIIDELEARRGCQLVGFSIERAPIEKRKTRYFHQLNIMDPRSWDKDALKLRWEAECKRSGRDGIGDGLIVLTVVTQAETPHHYSSHEEYIIKIEEELRNHCMSDHRFQATFSPQQKMKPAVQAYAIYVAITLLAQSSGQVWKGGSAVPAVSQYISAGHTTTVQDPFGACCKTRCLTYSGSKLSGSMHTHQFEESKRHTEVEKQDPSVSRDRQFHSSTLLLSSSGASRKTRSITSGRSKSSGSMHTHQYDEESKKHTEVEKQDPSVSRDRQSHHSSTLSSMSSSGTSCKTRSITYGGSESSRSESSSSMHTHQYDESAIYVEDDCERVDRERIHSQLEDLREEFAQTKERMLIERQRCEQLAEENAKLSIERKKAQEDIKVLTEQVNAYSREVDKQKGLVTQSQEKHKTEVNALNEKLANQKYKIKNMKQASMLESNKLQKKVASLQQMLSGFQKTWKLTPKEVSISGQELDRGGWGVVWVGQLRVAVKQLHKTIESQHNMDIFHHEIDTMSQLRHPNLLQFIGAVLDHPSGYPLIVTEVMDTSLHKAYENKELTPDPACRPVILSIMHDAAEGLNYLHCLPDPIIHRDVSSANVLLQSIAGPRKWKGKISDFGSAKLAKKAITEGPGAFAYSAPEALQSIANPDPTKKQTTKMDVFSYGVLLCEIITCRFPNMVNFQGMLLQVHSISNRPSGTRDTQGSLLHSLIVSCCHDDPSRRPTMKETIEQLDIISK